MALGLSITNKLARLWPGAPTAFAIHEYASLLGLVFVMYHGLVLMGDHFVDFSLPRLLVPFSIAYRTTWVGLGQVCFYIWLITAASFYVRPWIGQKTWRLIHYVNFATYTMGFLHGFNTGTESYTQWAYWYYLISGTSLAALLAYRIYDSVLKKKFSLREFVSQRIGALAQAMKRKAAPTAPKVKSVPEALLLEQAKRLAASRGKTNIPAAAPAPVQVIPAVVQTIIPASVQTIVTDHEQQTSTEKVLQPQTSEMPVVEHQTPIPTNIPVVPVMVSAISTPEAQMTSSAPMVKFKNTSPENKVNVCIFREPTTRPIEELQKYIEAKQAETTTLILRLKKDFFTIPVQPTTPNRKPGQMAFSED